MAPIAPAASPAQSAGDGSGEGEQDYSPVSFAHHVFRFLPTGAAAFAALDTSIAHARAAICLEMYIFKADATGARVRSALIAACRRGVRVRILLDAFGASDLPRDYFVDFIKYGGELRWFNPSRVLRVAFRNHRKLCVIDHAQAIVGGFNIGDEYDGDGVQSGWRDLGMRIEGPIVAELESSFSRLFVAAHMDRRATVLFARGRVDAARNLDAPMLLTSGPGFGGAQLRKLLYRDLQRAHRVAIVAAYFSPTWRLRRALRRAARHGIVRLLLPGVTDVPVMRLAAHHLYDRMLLHRIEIFEYLPQVLHAKLVVVDDIVYVGSSNFDTRSLQLNFDFLVRIPNAELAEQARRIFREDLARSQAITLPEWHAGDSLWRRAVRLVAYWLVTRLDPLLARRKWRALR